MFVTVFKSIYLKCQTPSKRRKTHEPISYINEVYDNNDKIPKCKWTMSCLSIKMNFGKDRSLIQKNTANAPSPRIMALVPIHPSPFSKGELQPCPR